MLAEALKLASVLQCSDCGSIVTLDDRELSRLLNANDRTPRLTLTLTPASRPGEAVAYSEAPDEDFLVALMAAHAGY